MTTKTNNGGGDAPMPGDVVFRGRALLGGQVRPATVVVRDGRITSVDDTGSGVTGRGEPVVELAEDEVLLPGVVDSHVHVNEPGRTHWEGFETATRAAAAGGVTTIIDMPLNSIPPTVDLPALGVKRAAADGQVYVDVGFWGGAVPSSLGHLAELHDAGVFGFKCFLLPSGVEEFAPLTSAELDTAMAEVAGFDGLLIVHAEDAATIAAAGACSGPDYADFLRSRPHEAEDIAIVGILELARKHGTRVHVVHLSSAHALDVLRQARADGVRVTVETCPHYLTLSAERIGAGQTQCKCCPPIRDEANQARLWEALAEGVVDAVVSDHSPSPPELKLLDTGDFGAAWGGISSLQLGLSLIWTEARQRGHDLGDVLGWMSRAPVTVAGVPHKGSIEVGYDADFAVFAPDERFVVDADRLQHRHPLTPYDGRELSGVVRQTWLRGRKIVGEDGFAPAAGRLLSRGE
ncbi:MAG: allantoinase AllB [Nocardioidaceae bacterium]